MNTRAIIQVAAGLVAGLALGAAATATGATEKDDWKPDYLCWYADVGKINCRVDLNTKGTTVKRFRETTYVNGEWWKTSTLWPQNIEGCCSDD